ncbi:hypothetical protein BGZ92_010780 [Podila epicladia]|nr:hypothetical protein BGZ92_010780 [Podila epicladia]
MSMFNQQQQQLQQQQQQQQHQNPQQQVLDGTFTVTNTTPSTSPSFALSSSTSASLPLPLPFPLPLPTSLPLDLLPPFPSGDPAHIQQRLQLQQQHHQAHLQLQNLQIRQRKRLDDQQPSVHSQPYRSDSFSVQDPQISDAFASSSYSDGFPQRTTQAQIFHPQGTTLDHYHSRPDFSIPIPVSVNTSPGHIDSNPSLVNTIHKSPSASSLPLPFLGFARKSLAPPQLVSTPVATTASSMDVMTMFPPLAPHHSFSPNSTLLLQDPIQLASLSIHDQKEVQLKQQQHLEQQQLQLKQQQEHTLLHQHHLQRQQVQQQHPLNVAPYYNPLKYEGMCEGGHSSHSAPKGLYNPDGVSRNLRIPSGSARTFVSA